MKELPTHEAVFCHTCGEVDELQTKRLVDLAEENRRQKGRLRVLEEQLESQREDIGNLEADLRTKRARIAALTAGQLEDFSSKNENNPLYSKATDVLNHWKATCYPGAREFGQNRYDPVYARMRAKPKGYTVEELKRCADGYAWKPYMIGHRRSATGTADDLKVEIDYIYRNAKYVEQGIRLADARDAMWEALSTPEAPNGPQTPQEAPPAPSTRGNEIARYVTGLNWALFPCTPGAKAPATPNGFEAATKDIERIANYWNQRPEANVAVRCGEPSGIVVIDVDDYKGGGESLVDLEKRYGKFPSTLSAKTPRGGQHYFFRHPGGYVAPEVDIVPGIDVRGDDSYVLIAPSVVDGKSYEWDNRSPAAELPEWLHKALTTRSTSRKSPQYWLKLAEGVTSGQRNQRMTELVGKMVGAGLEDDLVASVALAINMRFKPPMDKREVARIVGSIVGRHHRNGKGTA